jgi:hypothetical protein
MFNIFSQILAYYGTNLRYIPVVSPKVTHPSAQSYKNLREEGQLGLLVIVCLRVSRLANPLLLSSGPASPAAGSDLITTIGKLLLN